LKSDAREKEKGGGEFSTALFHENKKPGRD
jgi:hypothetical protein